MYQVRRWAIRHARFFEKIYHLVESTLLFCNPVFRWVGYDNVEKPIAFSEGIVKRFLFDSQMCGVCILSSTGMACPMNCPKQLRNGPCGGVRVDGNCEVKPDMRCVWVDAYEGIQQMTEPGAIQDFQSPVDHRLTGSSAWLREVRIKVENINPATKSLKV